MAVQKKGDSKKKEDKPDLPEAVKTKVLVAKNTSFYVHTSDRCPNGLIQADYYLENPKVACPICGKGSATYEHEGFID